MHNDPANCVDLWGLLKQCEVDKAEYELQTMAQNVNPLSDFIDTAKYAEIICSNMDRLDEETKKKYAGMPESVRETAIREQLNKTTVYSGIDPGQANTVLQQAGSPIDFNSVDGLTIGNNIYMKDPLDPKTADKSDIELLGHETIHSVQANAQGTISFLNDYMSKPYDTSNQYEVAAYSFGGKIRDTPFQNICSPQILPSLINSIRK